MTAFFVKAWLELKGWVIALGAALALVVAIYFKGKSAGRESAENKQREVEDAARERKESVKPVDAAGTAKRLRDGKF